MLDQQLSQYLHGPDGVYCPIASTCNWNSAQPNQLLGSRLSSSQSDAYWFRSRTSDRLYFTYQTSPAATGTTTIFAGHDPYRQWYKGLQQRFILGFRQQGGNGYFQPITLDAMVQR